MKNRMLKILFITEKWYPEGKGGELFFYNLTKCLQKKGHLISLITGSYVNKEINSHIIVLNQLKGKYGKNILSISTIFKRILYLFKVFFLIYKIKDKKFDIIHSISPVSSVLAHIFSSILKIPCVISVLSLGGEKWIKITKKSLKGIVLQFIERLSFKFFSGNKIIVISRKFINYLNIIGVSKEKIVYIPNAINFKIFKADSEPFFRKKYGIGNDKFILGYLGTLESVKNVESIIHAFKNLDSNRFFLLIAGDGPLRKDLESLSKKLELKNYLFLGKIKYSDVPLFLSSINVLIAPSISEGFPAVCLEAIAMNKPVIATDVGDINNILIHNKNGFIISQKNITSQIIKYCKMISTNPEKYKLNHEAYYSMKNNYSWENITKLYESIYYILVKKFRNL
ncbi:MAG: glycosyltransferase family 4 protein [Candidatus Helarchaeota archaeon]